MASAANPSPARGTTPEVAAPATFVPPPSSADENVLFRDIPEPTNQEITANIGKLELLAEGINGPNTFDIEKAAYGYIERHWRICMPRSMRSMLPVDSTTVPNFNSVELYTIMYHNYVRLRQASIDVNTSLWVSAYRTRLIKLGYLYQSAANRAVTVDEVDFVERCRNFHRDAAQASEEYTRGIATATTTEAQLRLYMRYGTNDAFKKFLKNAWSPASLTIIKHITFAAEQYAASTYLVFRQHGHHFQADLNQKYNTLWRATTIKTEGDVVYPGNEVVHRSAIHSFGMKALHDKFFFNLNNRKLAETYVERADVAPCGAALVATCNASILLLKSTPFWPSIYRSYSVQIEALFLEAAKLKDARLAIRYHKNARLFGEQRLRLNDDVAAALAPVAKGFILSLGEASDLSKQKTLDKRASQNPVVVEMVAKILRRVTQKAVKEQDMSAMNPNPNPPQPAQKKLKAKEEEDEEDYESEEESELEDEDEE